MAAQQIRISDSSNLVVFLFSSTDLTLEKARNIVLAPYNFVYPDIHKDFKSADIDTSRNQGFVVMDFDREYAENTEDLPLNYSLISQCDFPGFCEFYDLKMLEYYPEDTLLKKQNLIDSEKQVEIAKNNFPVSWPEEFGGDGANPISFNSNLKVKDKTSNFESDQDESMIFFKMGLSPILAQQQFNFKQSDKTLSSEQKMPDFSLKESEIKPMNFKKEKIKNSTNIILKKSETNSSPIKSPKPDIRMIRSKLSANQLKVINRLDDETGNRLLIDLFQRRFEKIQATRQKKQDEDNLVVERKKEAEHKIESLRNNYDERNKQNQKQISNKNEEIIDSESPFEFALKKIESDTKCKKLKQRFIDAVNLKFNVNNDN